MKAKATVIIAAAAAMLAPAAASAYWGLIISSFQLTPDTEPFATGIYRDDAYVYGILYSSANDYLRSYTVNGSVLGSVILGGMNTPRDADHSQLGSGYLDIIDEVTNQLVTYSVMGSMVDNKALPSDATGYAYREGSSFYYVARSSSVFRYTTAGSFVNSFYVGGTIRGLAVKYVENDFNGEVIFVGRAGSPTLTYAYSRTGSLLNWFFVPGDGGTYGAVCGPGVPSNKGETYWCNQHTGTERWAYQVDVQWPAVNVMPFSIGKIKALYR